MYSHRIKLESRLSRLLFLFDPACQSRRFLLNQLFQIASRAPFFARKNFNQANLFLLKVAERSEASNQISSYFDLWREASLRLPIFSEINFARKGYSGAKYRMCLFTGIARLLNFLYDAFSYAVIYSIYFYIIVVKWACQSVTRPVAV